MKPVFGFDIDGVLYDWHTPVYDYVKMYMKEMRGFDSFWQFTVEHKNEAPYDKMFWYNIVRDLTLLTKVSTPKSVVNAVNKVAKDFDVVYITHRPREARWTTYWWLKVNGFPLVGKGENLHVSYEPKDKTVRYFNCKYYVDDKETILKSLVNITQPIGVRKPWHLEDLEEQGIPFIDSVEELPALLKRI